MSPSPDGEEDGGSEVGEGAADAAVAALEADADGAIDGAMEGDGVALGLVSRMYSCRETDPGSSAWGMDISVKKPLGTVTTALKAPLPASSAPETGSTAAMRKVPVSRLRLPSSNRMRKTVSHELASR